MATGTGAGVVPRGGSRTKVWDGSGRERAAAWKIKEWLQLGWEAEVPNYAIRRRLLNRLWKACSWHPSRQQEHSLIERAITPFEAFSSYDHAPHAIRPRQTHSARPRLGGKLPLLEHDLGHYRRDKGSDCPRSSRSRADPPQRPTAARLRAWLAAWRTGWSRRTSRALTWSAAPWALVSCSKWLGAAAPVPSSRSIRVAFGKGGSVRFSGPPSWRRLSSCGRCIGCFRPSRVMSQAGRPSCFSFLQSRGRCRPHWY